MLLDYNNTHKTRVYTGTQSFFNSKKHCGKYCYGDYAVVEVN